MKTVSAFEFQRHFGRLQDEALKEPIAITNRGRARLVLMSMEEYERMQKRDRQVHRTIELPADVLEDIASSEMDPKG